MTTISIIVPVYQAEEYLRDCLDSLVQQDLKYYEILCIDDGSTDQSAEIIKEYMVKYSFIHYFYQSNSGVSAARNKGLSEAVGKYVMFVDADDWIKRNSLKHLFNKANYFAVDILVYGGRASNFFDTEEWLRDAFFTRNKLYTNNSIRALLSESGARPSVCNKLFLRKFLENMHFVEQIKISEDQAFLFLAFPSAHKILFDGKNVYRYRVSNNMSAMHQIVFDKMKFFQNHLDTVQYIFDDWKERNLFEQEREGLKQWIVSFLYVYQFLRSEEKQFFNKQLYSISDELKFDIINELNNKKIEKNKFFDFFRKYFVSICYQFKKYGMKYGLISLFLKIYEKFRNKGVEV